MLEDQKILGTLHIAFGASAGIGGVNVPVHLDCVVLEPTLDVGGTRVLDGGRVVLGAYAGGGRGNGGGVGGEGLYRSIPAASWRCRQTTPARIVQSCPEVTM